MRRISVSFAHRLRQGGRVLVLLACALTAHAMTPADGKRDYQQYCAACHGSAGQSDGPVARALNRAPTDLSRLSADNGGSFPETVVYRAIDGRAELSVHGSSEMPVWGNRFVAEGDNEDELEARIGRLIRYIETLQGSAD